jgi:hypothetical protein
MLPLLVEGAGLPVGLERHGAIDVFDRIQVAAEEPQLVLHQRAAEADSGLPAGVRVFRILNVLGFTRIGGVQAKGVTEPALEGVAADVRQQVAAEAVGAAARDHVDHRTGRSAELGVVAGRFDLHLLEEISDELLA